MRIVLLGPPGVGKGTQAKYMAEKLDVPHISTGDIFRKNVSLKTELGRKAEEYMKAGKLVPDEIVIDMVADRLSEDDCRAGYILDGFPRTLKQAESLTEILGKLGQGLDLVLNIIAGEEEIVRRLSGRRSCKDCGAVFHIIYKPPRNDAVCDNCGGELYQRKDDTEEVIRERLKVYRETTGPLEEYYRNKNLLTEISGEGDIKDVQARINNKIKV